MSNNAPSQEARHALLIGNSDGIGLATTRALLGRGLRVTGISRSASPIEHDLYQHHVARAQDPDFATRLASVIDSQGPPDVCIYFAGIGELLDPRHMEAEVEIFEVNLLGLVKTAAQVIPAMVARGAGQLIGLSSLADEMHSPEAPSYNASKAGFSCYLESLALALKPRGVAVTNLRFGFVDTKMAKGDVKPLMMSVERAVQHVLRCVDRRPIRHTAPRLAIPLIRLRRWMLNLRVATG